MMDLKRPDKVRFELEFNKETAARYSMESRAGSSGRTSIARKLSRFLRKKGRSLLSRGNCRPEVPGSIGGPASGGNGFNEATEAAVKRLCQSSGS